MKNIILTIMGACIGDTFWKGLEREDAFLMLKSVLLFAGLIALLIMKEI